MANMFAHIYLTHTATTLGTHWSHVCVHLRNASPEFTLLLVCFPPNPGKKRIFESYRNRCLISFSHKLALSVCLSVIWRWAGSTQLTETFINVQL